MQQRLVGFPIANTSRAARRGMATKQVQKANHVISMRAQSVTKYLKVLSLFLQAAYAVAQSYFPEVGREAILQRSINVRSNLRVLQIALEPGYEDLATLAYFRLGRGAKIMSAYVTNGEAGESDIHGEYPFQLAATRREEAAKAMASLEAEAYFFNMPDVVSAQDSTSLRTQWDGDSLRTLFMKLISDFKPDLILLSRDPDFGTPTPRWQFARDQLLDAVKRLKAVGPGGGPALPRWSVERVMGEGGTGKLRAPITNEHPHWRKNYQIIGEEIGREYASLAKQRLLWKSNEGGSYRVLYPVPSRKMRTFDESLPKPVSASLRSLDREIKSLAETIAKGRMADLSSTGEIGSVMTRLVVVLDSVGYHLVFAQALDPRTRRTLLDWKASLENLRNALLEIQVKYSVSETVLTEKQLTYVTIDTVIGLSREGKTDILFPAVNQGWALNEDIQQRLPLKLHEPYRLLSPGRLEFDVPHALNGLDKTSIGNPVFFFILHKALSKERSFTYRIKLVFHYAPRFTAEVLNPFIRVIPRERVVVQATSHSRDRVRDEIFVNDTTAVSNRVPFRFVQKEASAVDTLYLTWKGDIPEGTYLLPIQIGSDTVAHFVARKFRANIDTSKRVGVIASVPNSLTVEAIRRVGLQPRLIDLVSALDEQLRSLDVLVVDRRALTLCDDLISFRPQLEQFVSSGGHLIILAQDAFVWNEKPLIDGIKLKPSFLLDVGAPLRVDTTHVFLSGPNKLTTEDWEGWLFRRGYNTVSVNDASQFSVPVMMSKTGSPLLLSKTMGKGKTTYVDLALSSQWMYVHPGAFRLLANLLSY